MAEREVYNPETGNYELMYDDGIYETNPLMPPPPTVAPADPQADANDVMTNPNSPPPYGLPDGQEWYWNPDAGRWSTRTKPTTPPPPGGGDDPSGDDPGGGGGGGEVPGDDPGPTPTPPYVSPSGFEWPQYQMPAYINPGLFDPGPAFDPGPQFTFRDFVAPTAQSMQDEPGFQFRMDQGRKALESSAAGKGVLRSGGTLKDILGYGQNFASQEYGNVYNRALQEYDTNRGNAADIWGKQYGQRRDQFDTGYTQRKDRYAFGADNAGRQNTFNQTNALNDWNSKYGPASQEFDDLYRRWATEGGWLTDIATSGAD